VKQRKLPLTSKNSADRLLTFGRAFGRRQASPFHRAYPSSNARGFLVRVPRVPRGHRRRDGPPGQGLEHPQFGVRDEVTLCCPLLAR
jgi:hypothetical protein